MNRPIFTFSALASLLLCLCAIGIDISSYSVGRRWVDEGTAGVKSTTASEAGELVHWTVNIGPRAIDHQWQEQTPSPEPPPVNLIRDAGADVWQIQYWVLIMAAAMLPALWIVTLDWASWHSKFSLGQARPNH